MAKKNDETKTQVLMLLLAVALLAILLLAKEVIDKKNVSVTTTTKAIQNAEADFAKEGDIVEVDYVGRYLNGTIFDTSVKDAAVSAGLYVEGMEYKPIAFTLGMGEVVSGFENALIGMKVGEEKKITLTPEEAYGQWSAENIEEAPRVQQMPRVEEVNKTTFEIMTGQNATVGKILNLEEALWPMEIVKVENDLVYIRHNIVNGTVAPTMFGNTTITADEENIYSRLDVVPGQVLITQVGYLKVLNVTDATVTLDANNILAGQTITFEIKLISINQAEDQFAGQQIY